MSIEIIKPNDKLSDAYEINRRGEQFVASWRDAEGVVELGTCASRRDALYLIDEDWAKNGEVSNNTLHERVSALINAEFPSRDNTPEENFIPLHEGARDGYQIVEEEDGYLVRWYDQVEGWDAPLGPYASRREALESIAADWEAFGHMPSSIIPARVAELIAKLDA